MKISSFNPKAASCIVEHVRPIFDEFEKRYDAVKYPPSVLTRARAAFSSLTFTDSHLAEALVWKYGHWCKHRFPGSHGRLISELQIKLARGVPPPRMQGPLNTFAYWTRLIGLQRAFVTRVFLTHLAHPNEVPIVDQHNWRALRYLVSKCAPRRTLKRRADQWCDVMLLNQVLELLASRLHKERDQVDRFLMMYGKDGDLGT
jgi:hypothetical protein